MRTGGEGGVANVVSWVNAEENQEKKKAFHYVLWMSVART